MVILEVVTALESLAVAEGLRLEADMYRLLFNRNQEALVVATEKGLIRAATSSGRTLLSRAENGERGTLLKKSEQQVPIEILSAVSFGEEIVLNGITITGTRLGGPELNEPMIAYQMREAQPRESVDVDEAAKQLTPMQSDVLRLLLRGLQYKEISRHLGNSTNTVHHHVSEILRRLRCADRIELLAKFQMKSVDTDLPRKAISVPPLTQAQLIPNVSPAPKKQAVSAEKIRARRLVAS
jgi:DNA-binding NarL/FixJ family response regulator